MKIKDTPELRDISCIELESGAKKEINRGNGIIVFIPLAGVGRIKYKNCPTMVGFHLLGGRDVLKFGLQSDDAFILENESKKGESLRVLVLKIKV